MQGNINPASRRPAVATKDTKERIKRRGWIRIQKRLSEPRLAGFADGQILPLVPGITEPSFPVPTLEIITEFSHLTLKSNIKESVPVRELLPPFAGIISATKPNAGSHRKTAPIREEICDRRIGDRERIERIRDWHADTTRTKADGKAWDLERVGRERHSCQR